MLRKALLLLFLCLVSPIQAQQVENVGASMVVPAKSLGTAEIPLPFDLNYKAYAFLNKPPTCTVNYDSEGLGFTFTVPIKPNYMPKGLNKRDGDIFGDDRIELYLKSDDAGPYSHYAVNAVGAIADDKMHDRAWNGSAVHSVRMEKDHWVVQIKIPFADFGFDSTKSKTLKALVAAYSGEPGNSFYRASVSVPIDFAGAHFQTFVLSSALPFAEKVNIGNVTYDLTGCLKTPNHHKPDSRSDGLIRK